MTPIETKELTEQAKALLESALYLQDQVDDLEKIAKKLLGAIKQFSIHQ